MMQDEMNEKQQTDRQRKQNWLNEDKQMINSGKDLLQTKIHDTIEAIQNRIDRHGGVSR